MPKMSKDLIGLENVESYWPRRLLCVKNWTSYERRNDQGRIMYGQVTEPIYNIVSYTWGRFRANRDEEGSAIHIRGINWQIPRIKPHAQHGLQRPRLHLLRSQRSIHAGHSHVVCMHVNYAASIHTKNYCILHYKHHRFFFLTRPQRAKRPHSTPV